MKRIIIVLVVLISFNTINAQEAKVCRVDTITSLPVVNLNEVVVSAFLYKQPLLSLSRSASVIRLNQIVDNLQSNMIDVLADTPGFTQIWEYHSPIILRGMNSKRLIVLQDGCRRIGNFPGGYFAQDMNVYGSSKIEIIKGAGSVIYGTGAVSGIINVINELPFGDKRTNYNLISGYSTNNNEFTEVARMSHIDKRISISSSLKYRHSDNYFYGNGDIAKNTNAEDKDFSFNLAYKFSERQQIKLFSNYHYGDWGKPRGFNGNNKKFTKIRNTDKNAHVCLNYSYSLNADIIKSFHVNAFYDYGERDYYKYKFSAFTEELSSLDLVHYKNKYGGFQMYSLMNLFPDSRLTLGIDGHKFVLDNPMDLFNYYNNTQGIKRAYEDAGQNCLGVFANNEWQCLKSLKVVLGIRFDKINISEGFFNGKKGRESDLSAVSGNFGLVYSPVDGKYISFNVGRAFRIPTSEELFTEIMTCKGSKKGNPDLEPEYGWNYDLGFRGKSIDNNLVWDLSLFYNKMYGFITETAGSIDSGVDFTYANTDADIMGGELSSSYNFKNVFSKSDNILMRLTASHVYGIDKYKDDAPLFGIPPFRTTLGVKYHTLLKSKWVKEVFCKIKSKFNAEQNRVAAKPPKTGGGPWGYEKSSSNCTFNIGMGMSLKGLSYNPKLRFVVKNVLNTNYHPWGSYVPAMGRSFKMIVLFNI